jgi:cyclopropane-fatty-acyl-phospholipid synthase
MGRYFFTGGQMPSQTLLSQFQKDLTLEQTWQWSGEHYSKTSEAWLDLMDQNLDKIIPIMAQTYGPNQASIWFQRWRVFFMSCAELFGFDHGKEWGVTHYRFKNKGNSV